MSFLANIQANIDDFTRNLDKAQARLDVFSDTVGKDLAALGSKFQTIGGALSLGVTAPLTALGVGALKAYANVESLKNGLTAITGSIEEANRQFESLSRLSDRAGISLNDAAKATINLQTIGFTASKAELAIEGIANAAALLGKGQDDINGALYGLQQLANTDIPLGEDLNILKERLPQVSVLLKEAFGTARSEELQKLGISSSKVVDTILQGLNDLPKAQQGLARGWEIMQNALTNALSKIGDAVNSTFDFTASIGKLTGYINNLVERFSSLDQSTRKVIIAVSALAASVGPLLIGLGAILKLAPLVGTAFAALTAPVTLAVAAITAAAAAIYYYWDDIKKVVLNTIAAIQQGVSKFFNSVSSLANTLGLDGVSKSFKDLGGEFQTFSNNTQMRANEIGSEIKNIATSSDSATASTKDLDTAIVGLTGGLSNAKKDTRDYKGELTNLFSDWGYYTFQVDAITKKFTEYANIAKKAGASTAQMATIMREELGEKLALALNQFDLTSVKPKLTIDSSINIDTVAIGQQMDAVAKIVNDKAMILKSTFDTLTIDLGARLGAMATDAFTALGTALVNGDNILKSLGSSLLSSFGSILIELGQMAIQAGIGIEAVKKALTTLAGPVAIAAGVALVAVGSIFKAGASKLGNSMGSGSVGGGSSYGSSVTNTPDYSQFRGAMYNNEKQVVEFNIKGNNLYGVMNKTNNRNNRLG